VIKTPHAVCCHDDTSRNACSFGKSKTALAVPDFSQSATGKVS
jgi:hypothetical protein